jgi:hypothetical protein
METVNRYQDIAFIVDSSPKPDSGIASWALILNFISSVVSSTSRLCNNSYCYRFALVRYSDNADASFSFNDSDTLTSVQRYVNNTVYSPGNGSNLTSAFDFIRTRVLNNENRRTSASAVAIVITDNLPASANTPGLQTALLASKTTGIRVMVVGINTSRIDVNTVNQVASYNDAFQNYMVTIASDYSQLAYAVDRVAQGVVKSLPWGSPSSGLCCCLFPLGTVCDPVGVWKQRNFVSVFEACC